MKEKKVAEWLREADVLVVHTGAGMGKDSGLPVYRDEDGEWGSIEHESGQSIFEVMNPESLLANPEYVWRKHAERWKTFQKHMPHKGFSIIKKWIEHFQLEYFMQTSNIDNFFQRAGFSNEHIRELHGAMTWLQCSTPCKPTVWPMSKDADKLIEQIESGNYPKCPHCGALARPNVYMFRDKTYIDKLSREQKKRYERFMRSNEGKNIIVLEIGSGPHVQSIRQKTRELMLRYQAKVVRINPRDYKIKEPHIGLSDGALSALQKIDALL